MANELLIIKTTDVSFEHACAQLPEIAQKHKLGLLGMHDLKQKIESKGLPFPRECRVFEVCNPAWAQAVLTQAIEVSTALPCRIAVYVEGGRTTLATIKPTALLGMFQLPGANDVARTVESELTQIINEVAALPVAR